MTSREERVAHNEASARVINEKLEDAQVAEQGNGYLRIVCECGDADCSIVIAIAQAEYEHVRSDPHHFAIRKEHLQPDVETIVEETDRFVVVAKREGTPAEIVEEEDPRS